MQNLPLIAQHLQPIHLPAKEDFSFDDGLNINVTPRGEIACSVAKKPFTTVWTPGHMTPGGYTPSGKYRQARSVPGKSDKRSGK